MSNYEILSAPEVAMAKRLSDGAFVDAFEMLDFEFESPVDKASRIDCGVAAGSGLITGLLSVVLGKPLPLEEASKVGGKEADRIVVGAARSLGCKIPSDKAIFAEGRCDPDALAKAIRFLEKKFPIPQDTLTDLFGGGKQHHLRDFSHHPTPLGLFFSILGQFTQEGYGTTTDGAFARFAFPKGAPTGKNVHEKIAMGTISWIFHLASDIDGSSSNPGKGTGIPGPLLSLLKELSATPLFKNAKVDYKDGEIPFSTWVSKLFNGTYFRGKDGSPIKFDFRTEMGLATQIAEESLYVLANEAIVRVFYMVSRLASEIRENDVRTFGDLTKVEPRKYLPLKSRALTRMCTVASGTFVAVNSAGSAVKAGLACKGNKGTFAKAFFLNVNYPGVGRFAIACFFDAGYVREDVASAYRKALRDREEAERKRAEELGKLSGRYHFLTLNPEQTRLLYSIESMALAYDISKTKKPERAEAKIRWRNSWEEAVCEALGADRETFFIRGRQAFDLMDEGAARSQDTSWLYLLTLELVKFSPYAPLGSEEDAAFKKLKVETDYLSEVFCERQSAVDGKAVASLRKALSSAEGTVTGSRKRTAIAAAATVAAAAATAGGAFLFAPQIAILIAGEAVAGLSGAALTSTSLAIIGGGSLAVGGLGMAGGTAILTGGGALLGLAGSSAASAISLAAQSSEAFVQSECSKLLALCSEVAAKRFGRYDMVLLAAEGMRECADDLANQINRLDEKKGVDRKLLSQMKKSLRCMNRCIKALTKLLKQ